MDLISFMVVVWFLKVLAEDTWTTVKGQSNPRIDRRRARQKSRAGNPIWNQLLGWLGDVAQDAREESARSRQEKRDRQAEDRRKRDLEEHPRVDAEFTIDDERPAPDSTSPEPGQATEEQRPAERKKHEDLAAAECLLDICPIHGKGRKPEPQGNPNSSSTPTPGGDTMSEVVGLSAAIEYARRMAALANQHSTAGAEQYIGHLTERNVTGAALQTAYDMQAAFTNAAAAAEKHADELEKQRAVQEAYDQNPDAGDQEFQTAGR